MKNYQKKLIISSCLVCLCCLSISVKAASFNSYNSKYSQPTPRENYAEFCDSLVIPDAKQRVKLSSVYFDNFDLLAGDFRYSEIFSANNEKFQPNIYRTVKKQEFEKQIAYSTPQTSISAPPPEVYKINLSNKNSNSQVLKVNTKQPQSNPVYMYSMIDSENTPQDFEKSIARIKSYISINDLPNATSMLENLRNLSRNNNSRLFTIAGLYEKINRPDEACGIYKEISEAEPQKIEYLYSYAACLYKNNNDELAEKLFLQAIALKPDFMYSYYNLGNLYYKKGDYYKALDYFNKAMEVNPENPDVFYNIGVTLEILDHKTLARKFYNKCLELNPEDKQAAKAVERLD